MAHFAKLNSENVVDQVVVVHNNDAPDEISGVTFLNSLFGDANWVQTSYNGNIRKNYAGVGYTYDSARDAFIAPQPFPSWVMSEETCQWDAPVPMPTDGQYEWDESTTSWVRASA
jgi:hypothetical protein